MPSKRVMIRGRRWWGFGSGLGLMLQIVAEVEAGVRGKVRDTFDVRFVSLCLAMPLKARPLHGSVRVQET